jgi:hypothetical protein
MGFCFDAGMVTTRKKVMARTPIPGHEEARDASVPELVTSARRHILMRVRKETTWSASPTPKLEGAAVSSHLPLGPTDCWKKDWP